MQGAVTESGVVSRMARCEIHGLDYPQTFFPRVEGQEGFWVGTCPNCEADAKLEARANEILRTRKDEIARRARAAMRKHEREIEKRTDKDSTRDSAEYGKLRRPLWKEYHTNAIWNEVVYQIEQELKEKEIIPSLKGR
jgi:hypothetical protein